MHNSEYIKKQNLPIRWLFQCKANWGVCQKSSSSFLMTTTGSPRVWMLTIHKCNTSAQQFNLWQRPEDVMDNMAVVAPLSRLGNCPNVSVLSHYYYYYDYPCYYFVVVVFTTQNLHSLGLPPAHSNQENRVFRVPLSIRTFTH